MRAERAVWIPSHVPRDPGAGASADRLLEPGRGHRGEYPREGLGCFLVDGDLLEPRLGEQWSSNLDQLAAHPTAVDLDPACAFLYIAEPPERAFDVGSPERFHRPVRPADDFHRSGCRRCNAR